jgi:uncharacterized protein with GYD domain
MPSYIVLMSLTDQGIKTIKDAPARIEVMSKSLEAAGGRMVGFYTVMGQYDYVAIVEGPDDEAAMTQLITLGMLGNVRTTTLRAFSAKEFAKIVKKVSKPATKRKRA